MPRGNPNFIVLDSSGAVTYLFRGVIQARGLTLPSSSNAFPPDESMVQWLDESDGNSRVARLFGLHNPNNQLILESARTVGNFEQARLTLDAGFIANDAEVNIGMASTVTSFTRKLLDIQGRSDFWQKSVNEPDTHLACGGLGPFTMPVGLNSIAFTIDPPFPTGIRGVVGSLFPETHWNYTPHAFRVTGVNSADAVVTNTGAAQNCFIFYMAFGV